MSLVFVHSCVDIWSRKLDTQIFILGISLIFHVSVKHLLSIYRGLNTLKYLLLDNMLTKITHFYCSGVFSLPCNNNSSKLLLSIT